MVCIAMGGRWRFLGNNMVFIGKREHVRRGSVVAKVLRGDILILTAN